MRRALTATARSLAAGQAAVPVWTTVAASAASTSTTAVAVSAAASTTRAASSAAAGPLIGVCVLERLPVVTPTPPAWRTEYAEWQAGVHAGRYKTYPDELVGGGRGGDKGGGKGDKAGGGDDAPQPAASGAAATWTPAPRTTPADEAGDTSSLNRALDRRLFLVLTDGGGSPSTSSTPWRFPSAPHEGEEPMRAAAERALASTLAPAPGSPPLQTYFVGNAPAGHLPASAGGAGASAVSSGGTLFFHRAQLIAGTPAPVGGGGSVAWLTKEELAERAGPGPLADLVRKML